MNEQSKDRSTKKNFLTPLRPPSTLYPNKSADHPNRTNHLDNSHISRTSANKNHFQQQELIKSLLTILNYHKTRETFIGQKMKTESKTNPEDSVKKIKLTKNESSNLEENIEEILCWSKDYDQMLSFLQKALSSEQGEGIKSFFQKQQFCHLQDYNLIERSLQKLFSTKEKVTLPIFTTIEADLNNKEIKLADINQQQSVCFVDKDHLLHVIRQQQAKAIHTKVDPNEKSIDLKWVNSETILLLSIYNRVTFYHVGSDLKVIDVEKSDHDHLIAHQIHISDKFLSTEVLILICTSSQTTLLKATVRKDSISFEKEIVINNFQPVKNLQMLFIQSDSLEQKMIQQENDAPQMSFYGLGHHQRSVIKLDHILARSGLFWKAPKHYKIQELSTSSCKQFLLLLLTPSSKRFQEIEELDDLEASLEYQMVKLNHKGCIMQRSNHCLNCKDFPLGFFDYTGKQRFLEKILKMSVKMIPDWVRAFSWHNNIYYLSLKSGRIIYKHSNQGQDLKLYSSGPSNCLLFSNKKLLQLISTTEAKKQKIRIEWHRNLADRQTIIQRLARMNGIPQNLLMILRSIRNHDIDLEDLL